MAKFEVSITVVVEADSDDEAYAMVESTAQNMVCGEIESVEMGGVTDLSMAMDSDEDAGDPFDIEYD